MPLSPSPFLFVWHLAKACCRIPCRFAGNLCMFSVPQYRIYAFFCDNAYLATAAMILRLRVNGTHHANAGSFLSPWVMAYSATSTVFDSVRLARRSQEVLPSFHSTHRFHPFVVFRNCKFDPFLVRFECWGSKVL